VQSPDSARFPGMPQNTILTGAADVVAAPPELAASLVDLAKPRRGGIPPDTEPSEDSHAILMRRLETLLKRHASFNLGDYKRESVGRRIERRMGLCRIPDFEDYVAFLQKNPDECENLAKDMLISVTRFFRDPDVFSRLRETVLPGLVKESRGRPLRIWVPGCATGEEAYTIAMLLDDALTGCGETGQPYKIFATDLDRHALEIAGQGLYPESALEGVPDDFRIRYFTPDRGAHLIARQLREHMVFAKHNILKDPPFNRLDLISCRNLLIYLQPHAQQRVLSIVHFSLRQGGILVLGLSETVGDMAEDFGAVDNRQHIFHKKAHTHTMLPETIPIAVARGSHGVHSPAPSSPLSHHDISSTRLVEAFTDRILSRYDRVCFVLNQRLEILYSFGDTRRHIGLRSGRASMNLGDFLPKNLSAALYTVAARVLAGEKPCRFGPIPVDDTANAPAVTLLVESIRPAKDDRVYLLVFFEGSEQPEDIEENLIGLRESMQRIAELEEELRESRTRLKTAVEELEASNEELQTSNEELQASNEELQSTNEELESVNEELQTLNNDHQFKINELANSNEDMDNFISSADIATLFLDPDLRIRRYTPSAGRQTGLLPHDIGREIDALSHPLLVKAAEAARRILAGADFFEFNIPGDHGKTVHLRATPYVRKDGARAGATISLIPIGSP
jgi:two-component system CheB/CheR fusion protein